MKLEGAAATAFEKWYEGSREDMNWFDLNDEPYEERGFYSMSDSMQYGVYVDWGYSVELSLDALCYGSVAMVKGKNHFEVRVIAVQKLSELYNNQER